MREFEIAPGRLVGDGHPTYVIAEIGQNHQERDEVIRVLKKVE